MIQLRRAQLLVKQQELVSAIRVADKVEGDFPDFSLQHEVDYLVARAYAARGEYSSARKYYDKVVSSDPERLREVTAMAKWMTGETFLHQKNYTSAIESYAALADDTSYPNWQAAGYLQIGKCFESMENIEQAVESYSRVVDEFGDSGSAEEAQRRLNILEQES